MVPGCLCCQPTAGGAKARIEAARTIAALAALASRSAGAAAATTAITQQEQQQQEEAAAAALAAAVEEMLKQVGATLRLEVGAHVEVLETGSGSWRSGVVEATWWRDEAWPWDQPAAPYRVRLDEAGELVCAEIDREERIRGTARCG